MSREPTLAYTVHHKGRKYLAGTTAEEIGVVAAEFGEHVWEGGVGPAKAARPPAPTPEVPGGGAYTTQAPEPSDLPVMPEVPGGGAYTTQAPEPSDLPVMEEPPAEPSAPAESPAEAEPGRRTGRRGVSSN